MSKLVTVLVVLTALAVPVGFAALYLAWRERWVDEEYRPGDERPPHRWLA